MKMRIFFSGAFTTIIIYFVLKVTFLLSGVNIDGLKGNELSTVNCILVMAFICGAVSQAIKQIKEW